MQKEKSAVGKEKISETCSTFALFYSKSLHFFGGFDILITNIFDRRKEQNYGKTKNSCGR